MSPAEFTPEMHRIMTQLARDLTSYAERHLIGARRSVSIAQQTADYYLKELRLDLPESAWDITVTVHQPYSCTVPGCRHQEPTGATCPIHLRDLHPVMLDCRADIRAKQPVWKITNTFRFV